MRLEVSLGVNSYDIIIEKNSLKNLGEKVKSVFKGEKIVIITDENVDVFYGQLVEQSLVDVGFFVDKIVFPYGEKTKTIGNAIILYNKMLVAGISRKDLMITLGGGVIGDLGGFVAATYLRGINFIQVPTSLLAQIDSSIGGKVGIDLPAGKNLVGAFHQPKAVFIDSSIINTLPTKFFIDGIGEAVKYGAIFDKDLFELIKKNRYIKENFNFLDMDELIKRCCFWKKTTIEEDEKEVGRRALLNFGHTFAHCIEKVEGYKGYTHGEAVAIGMCTITKGSEALGLTKQGTYDSLKELIISLGLPNAFPIEKKESVLEVLWYDKKVVGSHINLILLKEIGVGYMQEMTKEQVIEILNKGITQEK